MAVQGNAGRAQLPLSERWRPRTLGEVVGQWDAVRKLREFAAPWRDNPTLPAVRVAVLEGPPGSGKTAAALALAADSGWGTVEMNGSDARNEGAMGEVAGRASLANTFTEDGRYLSSTKGEHNLIVIDEADSLSSTSRKGGASKARPSAGDRGAKDDKPASVTDEGGMSALARLVATTKQPVLLTVNDAYPLYRAGALKKGQAARIRFYPVERNALKTCLHRVATAEHMVLTVQALDAIVDRSNGDLRAALNDLEAVAALGPGTDPNDVLGDRALETNLFEASKQFLLSGRFLPIAEIMTITDAPPDDIWPWIEENIPKFAKDADALYRGLDMIARGQLHLARANRWRIWSLWGYASEMFTGGVSTSLHEGNPPSWYGSPSVDFPSIFTGLRGARDLYGSKEPAMIVLASFVHMSRRRTKGEIVPMLKSIHRSIEERDPEALAHLREWEGGVARTLEVPPEEISSLLDVAERPSEVKKPARRSRKTRSLEEAG